MQIQRQPRDAIIIPQLVPSNETILVGLIIIITLGLSIIQTWVGARSTTIVFYGLNIIALVLGLIWFGIVCYIGLRRPIPLVAAMAFFNFFTAWRPIDLPVGSFQPSQLLALSVVGCMLARAAVHSQQSPSSLRFSQPMLILVILVVISTLQTSALNIQTFEQLPIFRSGRADPFIRASTTVAALLIGMCAYIATSHLLTKLALIHLVLKSWLLGAVFSILVGIYLWIRYYVRSLPGLPFTAALGVGGSGVVERDAAVLTVGNDFIVRITAFAMEPRHLSYLLMPVLCFLFVYLFMDNNLTGSKWRWVLLTAGVVTVGFIMTTSRSTYVLAVIAVLIILWVTRSKWLSSTSALIRMLILLVVVGGLTLVTLQGISGRDPLEFVRLQVASLMQTKLEGSGVPYAIDGYLVSVYMFADNPLIGQGWGSYVYFTNAYNLRYAQQSIPNNLYLLMLGETGLVGFLVLIWIFWQGWRRAFSQLPLIVAQTYRPLLFALGAALLATYASFMFWDTIQYTHLWMLLGLVQAARMAAKKEAACALA